MKNIKKTTVRNRLDKLWSLIIRSIGYCEVCTKTNREGQLHPHHIIGRSSLNTRWDLKNGICLCAKCHTLGKPSAHNDPIWFIEWLKTNQLERYKYLEKKRKEKPFPYSIEDYLDIEKELKK